MSVILGIIAIFLNIYSILLIIRALLSWFPVDRDSAPVRILHQLTEPLLEPIRNLLPRTGMFDFSILVAYFLIFALQRALVILARGF